jgi:hypothetical protein
MRFPGVGSRAVSFRRACGVAKGLYWNVRFGGFAGVGDTQSTACLPWMVP